MEFQAFAGATHTLQTLAAAVLVFAICAYLPKLQYRSQVAKLPLFGTTSAGEKQRKEYIASSKQIYIGGYQKFKNSVFRILTDNADDNIVVPSALLPELRKLPDDVLSFPAAVDRNMQTRYTGITADVPLIVHSVKMDLTPALVRLNPVICEEVDAGLKDYMPPCKDWTEVCIHDTLIDIVARVSGRLFVGPELCVDPEYLRVAKNYTLDVMKAVFAVKSVRPWLRPFVAHRLPQILAIREHEQQATDFIYPIVKERVESAKNDPGYVKSDDMLQWMIDRSNGTKSVKELARLQLGLIFAALHTTTTTATNILYTLAVTPEFIEPLRAEIREVLADNDGIITSRALQQMAKLDSYMKECIRVYPPGVTAFNRRVLKGIHLSNGQYIPPGVIVESPSHAVYSDPAYYPDSETFDPLRSYKLRQSGSAGDIARNQCVTANESNQAFGYGRHACPGRFFATNEIKMVLARVILHYDIKMPNGVTERYPQKEFGRQSSPPSDKMLMFKLVEV